MVELWCLKGGDVVIGYGDVASQLWICGVLEAEMLCLRCRGVLVVERAGHATFFPCHLTMRGHVMMIHQQYTERH